MNISSRQREAKDISSRGRNFIQHSRIRCTVCPRAWFQKCGYVLQAKEGEKNVSKIGTRMAHGGRDKVEKFRAFLERFQKGCQ